METGQAVTNRAFLLEFDPQVGGVGNNLTREYCVLPKSIIRLHFARRGIRKHYLQSIFHNWRNGAKRGFNNNTIDISAFQMGFYQLELSGSKKVTKGGFVVSH